MTKKYRELPKLSFSETRDLLLEKIEPLNSENVTIDECLGRVSARIYFATNAVPNFVKSPLDGYAMRSCDIRYASEDNPVTLKVVDEIRAGVLPTKVINKGEAAKILTGAPVPQNADCVIMYEQTEFDEKSVTVKQSLKPQQNIIQIGEDQQKGMMLVPRGSAINPAMIGLLASQGFHEICTYKTPEIAVISTGDEVQDLDQPLVFGKVYNSTRYLLAAELRKMNFRCNYLGIAQDNVENITALIDKGMEENDTVIITGGVSAGDYDLVPEAMQKCGIEIMAYGVRMKPGMACCYGIKKGKLCIGLSGNPASAMINFHAVAKPLLKKQAGFAEVCPKLFKVRVINAFGKTAKSDRLLRGSLVLENGSCEMKVNAEQGNIVISSMVNADLLAIVPKEHGPVNPGDELDAFFI